jgi:hypothetical protein
VEKEKVKELEDEKFKLEEEVILLRRDLELVS